MSDVMNGGMTQGLKQAGLWGDGILIGRYDGGMVVVKQMMDDPKGPLQADASNQPWDQGVAAVKMALRGLQQGRLGLPRQDANISRRPW